MHKLVLERANGDVPWTRKWEWTGKDPHFSPVIVVENLLGWVPKGFPHSWSGFDPTKNMLIPWYGQALSIDGPPPKEFIRAIWINGGFNVSCQWVKPDILKKSPLPHLRPQFRRLGAHLRIRPNRWKVRKGTNLEWDEMHNQIIRMVADYRVLFGGKGKWSPLVELKFRQTGDFTDTNVSYNVDVGLNDREGSWTAKLTTLVPTDSKALNSWKLESRPLVVASPHYQTALEEIASILRSHCPRSILVIGPPGCGKEVMFDVVTYGLGKGGHDKRDRMSVAGMKMGKQDDVKRLDKFIADHCKNVIILDEIDKCDEDMRSYLLRILEDKSITLNGDHIKLDTATWCMAASRPIKVLRGEVLPLDFWTRMEYVVSVKHPLDIDEASHRENVVKEYLRFFWQILINDEGSELANHMELKKYLHWLDSQKELPIKAAADALYDTRRYDLSIRELRSLTAHVFNDLKTLHYDKVAFEDLSRRKDLKDLQYRFRDVALRYIAGVPL